MPTTEPKPSDKVRSPWLFKRVFLPLFFLGVINFAVFVLIALSIGGDAGNGKVEGSRYYVSNHGIYTEVSKPVYIYSFIHVVSVFVSLAALGIVEGWLLLTGQLKSCRAGDSRGDSTP